MLIGEYAIALGEKNRIALPKRLRQELSDQLIVTRGYEGCALLLTKASWVQLLKSVEQNALFKLNVRDTRRYLLGGAMDIELDSQGRTVLPDYIISHIQGESELVMLGVGEWIEIWSKEQWKIKADYLKANAADIAERLVQGNG